MPLTTGERLGPYEILDPVGAGGMGEVYRARDTRLDREVALKVLPESLAGDPERLRRFEREARATAALNHPNILALHDVGEQDGRHFVVTELLEGETLWQRLRSGLLPAATAVDVALQTVRGLVAAHRKGIVHRDLKPANLFLTEDGLVKILDFGLARSPASDTEAGETESLLTEPGRALGTMGYASPEQLRGKAVDARSDIFSLGVVLYEMLVGRRPFAGATAADTSAAILTDDPPPPSVAGRSLAAGLDGLVLRCLEKRPQDRFQSPHDLGLALEAIAAGVETSASVAARARRHRVGQAGFLLAVAAALASVWLASRGPPDAGRDASGPAAATPPLDPRAPFRESGPVGKGVLRRGHRRGDQQPALEPRRTAPDLAAIGQGLHRS